MFDKLKRRFPEWLRNPVIILGSAGFTATFAACYGPPPAVMRGELTQNEINTMSECVDGTKTSEYCIYGCKQSRCIKKFGKAGEACDPDFYIDTCADANSSLLCENGVMVNVPCSQCQNVDTGVTCADE